MPKFAANLSFLFQEHDFLDRFAAARLAGFQAAEYLFPYDLAPPAEIAARLDDNGLAQVLFNLGQGTGRPASAASPHCRAGRTTFAARSTTRSATPMRFAAARST